VHDLQIRSDNDGIIEGTFVVKIVAALDYASTRITPNLNVTRSNIKIVGMMSNFNVRIAHQVRTPQIEEKNIPCIYPTPYIVRIIIPNIHSHNLSPTDRQDLPTLWRKCHCYNM